MLQLRCYERTLIGNRHFWTGLIALAKFSHSRGHPHEPFLHGEIGQWMPYKFVTDSIHANKLCNRLSSSEVQFYTENSPFGGLRTTHDVHLRLTGKHIVDFLLVLIAIFSLSVTAKALRANISWKSAFSFQQGQFGPKFQVDGVSPHQSFFFSKN